MFPDVVTNAGVTDLKSSGEYVNGMWAYDGLKRIV